jgi:hypothetical protein
MKKQGLNLGTRVLATLLFAGVIVILSFRGSAEEWAEAQKEVWKSSVTA